MASMTRRSALRVAASALGVLLPQAALASPSAVAAQGSGLQFQLYQDSRKAFRWRLKAANGRVLATSSEGYKAKADCRHAIELIMQGAATATVVEVP